MLPGLAKESLVGGVYGGSGEFRVCNRYKKTTVVVEYKLKFTRSLLLSYEAVTVVGGKFTGLLPPSVTSS